MTTEPHMTFWDHLEELRWVILKSIIAVVTATVGAFFLTSYLGEIMQLPLQNLETDVKLIFMGPLDAFIVRLKLGLLAGIVFAIPFLLYFMWDFLAPGLHKHERRTAWIAIIAGSVFFCAGASFAYCLLFFGLPALINMGLAGAEHMWSLKIYLSFCFRFLLAFGVIFELPVVIVTLARLGLIKAETLRKIRPYAVITIFILGAFLTPPDPFTQIMLGLPLILLYEISIFLASLAERKRRGGNI